MRDVWSYVRTDRMLLAELLDEHDTLTRRVNAFDRYIANALASRADRVSSARNDPRYRLRVGLRQVDRGRNRRGGVRRRPALAAWAGVCPGNNGGAGKRRSGRGRPGNETLRAVLVECAHAAARTHDCQFRAYHKALMVRRGYKRAISAIAHKLLRSVFAVLRDRRP